MRSLNALVVSFLVVSLCCTASAFLGPVSRLQHVSKNKGGAVSATSSTSYPLLRSQRSLGALRMAEEGSMEAAEAKAKLLSEKAEALRAEAASSEAEIRPPQEAAPEAPAQRELRPEELPPPQKISNDMKKRLRQELINQGADPNRTVGNPILVISAVIAVLVVVGGKGIFY